MQYVYSTEFFSLFRLFLMLILTPFYYLSLNLTIYFFEIFMIILHNHYLVYFILFYNFKLRSNDDDFLFSF